MTNQEAIKILQDELKHTEMHLQDMFKDDEFYEEMNIYIVAVRLAIKALAERPQGKWIYHKAVDYFLPCMECNNCHEEFLLNDLTPAYFKKVKHFCSNCGADMRKGGADHG